MLDKNELQEYLQKDEEARELNLNSSIFHKVVQMYSDMCKALKVNRIKDYKGIRIITDF